MRVGYNLCVHGMSTAYKNNYPFVARTTVWWFDVTTHTAMLQYSIWLSKVDMPVG